MGKSATVGACWASQAMRAVSLCPAGTAASRGRPRGDESLTERAARHVGLKSPSERNVSG